MGFNWDDIIKRLGNMAANDPLYLKKLEDIARRNNVADDLARGSGMALRARNAERTFLQELADTDLPAPRQYGPSDLSRAANDDLRRDMQYGPFPAGSPGVMWDIRRAAERNISEAAAAAAQAQRYRPINSAQLTNDATTAALALGAGSLAGGLAIEAMRSADPAGEQQRARSGLAASLPPAAQTESGGAPLTPDQAVAALQVAGRRVAPSPEETASAGLYANLPGLPQQAENLAASSTEISADTPLATKKSKDPYYLTTNEQKAAEIRRNAKKRSDNRGPIPVDTPESTEALAPLSDAAQPPAGDQNFLSSVDEQDAENARLASKFGKRLRDELTQTAAANGNAASMGEIADRSFIAPLPPMSDTPSAPLLPGRSASEQRAMQDNRFWGQPGVRERKIARMAKAAGLTPDEAEALVAAGSERASGMTDANYALTAQGRAEEFRGLRKAVAKRRSADEESRMNRWKAQSMLAGRNPGRNAVNAWYELPEQDRQAAIQYTLAGNKGATPLDVQQQRAVVDQRRQLIEADNAGKLEQIQAQAAAERDLWEKRLAQSGQQIETDRALRLKEMEEQYNRQRAEISARLEQSRQDNQSRIDAAIAGIQGAAANARTEADSRRDVAQIEADTLRQKFNNPMQEMHARSLLASQQSERRSRLLAAAQQEANKYGDDKGYLNYLSRATGFGYDPTFVSKSEQQKIRDYLKAIDPQATPEEIEQLLAAALRDKTQGM